MGGLESLEPARGAVRGRKRVGRGPGSGLGKTAGRGHKGARSRSGYSHRRGFEGGQMPLIRRIPKRGFTNKFATESVVLNVRDLDKYDEGTVVTPELLTAEGRMPKAGAKLRILGKGDMKKELVVRAHHVSAGAKAKIEAAGGRVEVLPA